jgi:hypothetical protein
MMFQPRSRYAKGETYTVVDVRGREVAVVTPAPAPRPSLLGIHLLKQGQRLDHLAALYLNDPAGFWRVAEQNDAMLPEALSGVWGFADPPSVSGVPDGAAKPPEIEIPTKNS